jgi:hypothetical protein
MLIPAWLFLERLKLRLVFPCRQFDEALDVLGFQHAAESVFAEPAAVHHYVVLYPAQFKPELSWVI